MSGLRDRRLISGVFGALIAALAGLAYARQMGRDPFSTVGVAMSIYALFHVVQIVDGRLRP